LQRSGFLSALMASSTIAMKLSQAGSIARGNLTTPGQMGLIGRAQAQPRSFDALQASPVRTIGASPLSARVDCDR
jgi:hypothetical protein